jgi:MFS family permease
MAFAFFMPTRNAWIADLVDPEDRAAAFGFLFMAFPIGGILGPTLGGLVADEMGWTTLFLITATIHGLSLIPMMTTREATDIKDERLLDTKPPEGRNQVFLLLALLVFLFGLGFGTVNTVIPIYLTERFQSTKTQIGLFTSIGFGVTATLAQIAGPRLAKRFGEGSVVLYCCSILPLTFLLWPYSTSFIQVLVLRMLATAAWSTTWSSTTSILMDTAPSSRRGLYSGLIQTCIMFGFTLGPTLAGILWEEVGYHAPLYASSFIFTLAVPTAALLRRSWLTTND